LFPCDRGLLKWIYPISSLVSLHSENRIEIKKAVFLLNQYHDRVYFYHPVCERGIRLCWASRGVVNEALTVEGMRSTASFVTLEDLPAIRANRSMPSMAGTSGFID
jgi:hypothetical protein